MDKIFVVSIPQAVWIACNINAAFHEMRHICFNTASGMDCMQLSLLLGC